MVILQRNSEPIPGYFLAEKLGEGSFGVVWSADGPGQTRMALKFLDLSRAGGVKEFEAISAIKNIRHPNLLPTIGYWLLGDRGQVVSDGRASRFRSGTNQPTTLVIAMVAGEKSLVDVLEEFQSIGKAGIPIEQLLEYMKDIARGLDFLNAPRHDLGDGRLSAIQHRDIKPDNILIVGDAAVLCDFGVARACHADSIRTTGMIGSPAFISPESISGSGSNHASDQYSLALTYYYLRTGTHAVLATNQATAINCHVSGELDFSNVGDAEREVLRRATQLDASQRFESCREMVRAIDRSVAEAIPLGFSESQTGVADADVTATQVDPRFHSTTAAEDVGNRLVDANQVQGAGELQRSAMGNRSRSAGNRTGSWRKTRRNHSSRLLTIASSTAMIALAMLALMMVSGGPRVAANAAFVDRQTINVATVVAEKFEQQTPERSDSQAKAKPSLEHIPLEPDWTSAVQRVQLRSSPLEPRVVPEPVGETVQFSIGNDAIANPTVEITAIEVPIEGAGGTAGAAAIETASDLPPATQALSSEELALIAYRRLGASFSVDGSELDLSETAICDADLSRLKDIPRLTSLSLENTSIGDVGLSEIAKNQPDLQSLYLSGTKVSDAGLVHLKKLSNLCRLDLSSCDIHDAGLTRLRALEGLTAIGLDSTKVSEQAVLGLSEALRHGAVIQGPEFSLLGGQRF